MRHRALRSHSQTVCLMLLLSFTAFIKMSNQTEYLEVVLNSSWKLQFTPKQLRSFYWCICSSGSVETCSIGGSSNTSQNFPVNKVGFDKNLSMPNSNTHSAEVYVFDCTPHLSNGFTCPCNRKLATNSTCTNSSAVSSGFHQLPPTNGPCKNCSTICWINFFNVTYNWGSNFMKPVKGKCYGSANETSSVSGVYTDFTTQYTSSTTNNVSSTTVSTTDSSNSTTFSTSEGVLSNTVSTAKHTYSTTIYITKKTSTTTHPFTTENNTVPLDLSQQKAGLNSSGQDSQALGIGVGLSCAVLAVVAIVAVLIFYRRKRFKEREKAEERRISYIQPSRTDCVGADDACDRDKGNLPMTFDNSSYDCSTYSHDYQPYSALENTYSSIPDGHFSVSNDNFDKNTKRTPVYELAKNDTSLRKKILRQNIIKESEEEEDVEEVDNPYIELSIESNDSGIALPDYSLATTASIDVEEKHIPNNHVYNQLNAKTKNPDLETYNVASDESATVQSHLYNRLRENTETPTLDTYNMASPKDVQPKNVYNRLNDNAKQNDLETYNKASGNKIENENQQSYIYDRVKDPRAKSTPGTYSLAAGVKSDQQQKINNKLDKPTETPDRKTYHTTSAVGDQLKSIDHRVNDKTKTYDQAGETNQISPYNRLHDEALTPDLDSYNTALGDKNGQSSPYNRLNEKADMPDLGTYNLASEKPKAQPNHTYNKLNGEPLEPDLGTYNKASGELYKTSFDFSQTLDNENDDSEDSNVDYFTLEQE